MMIFIIIWRSWRWILDHDYAVMIIMLWWWYDMKIWWWKWKLAGCGLPVWGCQLTSAGVWGGIHPKSPGSQYHKCQNIPKLAINFWKCKILRPTSEIRNIMNSFSNNFWKCCNNFMETLKCSTKIRNTKMCNKFFLQQQQQQGFTRRNNKQVPKIRSKNWNIITMIRSKN